MSQPNKEVPSAGIISGSLSNGDGDGNVNGKKAITVD